eukprot:6188318-Pleurochrysis_carterae.AAC.3
MGAWAGAHMAAFGWRRGKCQSSSVIGGSKTKVEGCSEGAGPSDPGAGAAAVPATGAAAAGAAAVLATGAAEEADAGQPGQQAQGA